MGAGSGPRLIRSMLNSLNNRRIRSAVGVIKLAKKKGERYECEECGMIVVVEDECGCDECDIVCCETPMKKVKKVAPKKATAKKAAPKKKKSAPKKPVKKKK